MDRACNFRIAWACSWRVYIRQQSYAERDGTGRNEGRCGLVLVDVSRRVRAKGNVVEAVE